MTTRTPSSATSGFFQNLPKIPPQYSSPSITSSTNSASDDIILDRIINLYLPSPVSSEISTSLHDLARLVLKPEVLAHTVDADTNLPTLQLFNTFGDENKVNPLRTSQGWKVLKDIQTIHGAVALAYPKENGQDITHNPRVHQMLMHHIWTGTSAVVTCPMGMTDGAAILLRRHLNDPDGDQPGRKAVFAESFRRLISRDPSQAWSSGQWMTERTGGSDVSRTETVACRMTEAEIEQDSKLGRDKDAIGQPLGPWIISGFKWFSSATDADMTCLLAQTPKGLSAFYAPMRRRSGNSYQNDDQYNIEMNGVRIQRLKNKLGTKAVPTAELEIKQMRGYLIGQEGQGVKEISAILNLTRLSTAGSVSGLGRGLTISRAYTKVRNVKSGPLTSNPQHIRWLADETVKYWASTHFYFFGSALLGVSERGSSIITKNSHPIIPESATQVNYLLRLFTPVMKSTCTMACVSGLRACMESLGGVGYCENNDLDSASGTLNIARLFRDANVNPIWEGTTSIMAEDVIRVLKDRQTDTPTAVLIVFQDWVLESLKNATSNASDLFTEEITATNTLLDTFTTSIRTQPSARLLHRGRNLLSQIESISCACLLITSAILDRDEVAIEAARRWIWERVEKRERNLNWEDEIIMDKKIFLGNVENQIESNINAATIGANSLLSEKLQARL